MQPVYRLYAIAHFCTKHKLSFVAFFIRLFLRVICSCDIDCKATIGKGTKFQHHALGVLIHPDAVIGENCTILQHVTIGGKKGSNGLPKIGNNVVIGAYSLLLGNLTVGDNAIIGAASLVLKNVPENAVVVGNPARILKYIDNDNSVIPQKEHDLS